MAVMHGYMLLENRTKRHGGGAVLCIKEILECMELHLREDDELLKSFWISIKVQTNEGATVTICYKPPDQEEEVDEAFYRKQPHRHTPWFLRGTSTSLTSSGEATKQSTNTPGDSWKALPIPF